jgi:mannose-6-phosphate isomerase
VISENKAVIRTGNEQFGKKIEDEEIYAVQPGEKVTVEGNAKIMRIFAK